ncbi:glycoside hydrolase family 30 protein [Athelia psychrophila]|uniref:Glycoside hydrolase family 30 protein n=1 Tax=Athelia psychrophila TaxID=1759441 RepID=A0A167XIZ8_9AGAM|nr:glycoside hydrolase family 30 protein [Fibularhizoctonia sp. CBS 109695]
MRSLSLVTCFGLVQHIAGQQIYDIWQTTWDQQHLFSDISPTTPINFVTPGAIGQADIVVNDAQVYQTMAGFGSSLTDSAALVLSEMKTANAANYWSLLGYMFDPTDGKGGAGLSYVRVPLGASDFSANLYSFDDHSGDTSMADFAISAAPSYLFSTLKDIMSINSILKVHILPWSPAWMKTGGTMNGGGLNAAYNTQYATYLLKCLQGFQSEGITPYAISIQNEPENSNPTYPSANILVAQEAQIGLALRPLMNNNGFSAVKLVGFEHNWNDAGAYPVQLMQQASSAFDSVAFHCYSGTVDEQSAFTSAYPSKGVYFTECAGTIGSDWWSDIKWWIGAVQYGAQSGLMWNLAVNGAGLPELPGSNSCGGGGCRGVATVNADGSYSLNQEFYSMAQASKAIVPKDAGGPFAQRIGVTVGGSLNWALVVGAYQTKRVSSTDYNRYSIVVLNWDDSSSTTWNPVPVTTTIEFRGMQATYTFPVGVTTLWWFASATSAAPGAHNFSPWNTTVPSNVTSNPGHYRPRRSSPL